MRFPLNPGNQVLADSWSGATRTNKTSAGSASRQLPCGLKIGPHRGHQNV